MPCYLYYCDVEKVEFEAIHSITEELQECPKCAEAERPSHLPKRLIAPTSFVLIGGGWGSSGYSSK
jgi:putative FmdB family regulatory protein